MIYTGFYKDDKVEAGTLGGLKMRLTKVANPSQEELDIALCYIHYGTEYEKHFLLERKNKISGDSIKFGQWK